MTDHNDNAGDTKMCPKCGIVKPRSGFYKDKRSPSGVRTPCADCVKRVRHGTIGRLRVTWNDMKRRCTNPKSSNYKNYGGRGITFCGEWESFENFKTWALSNGYANDLTIDRIDPDGNYEPSNCQWVSFYENRVRANRGSANLHAKLTEDSVRAIRQSDESNKRLAERHGVAACTIGAIKRRETWTHVK